MTGLGEHFAVTLLQQETRLSEAQELGLVDTKAVQGERGTSHAYVLTEKGGFVRYILDEIGVMGTYSLIRAYRERVEGQVEEAKEELKAREEEFEDGFKTWNRLTQIQRREKGFEDDGFASYREKATKTISPLSRIEALTLPSLTDVEAGLQRYLEQKERAADLEAKQDRTSEAIDQTVYRLYGLTDEEIEAVEAAADCN